MTDKEKIEDARNNRIITEQEYDLLMWRIKTIEEINY